MEDVDFGSAEAVAEAVRGRVLSNGLERERYRDDARAAAGSLREMQAAMAEGFRQAGLSAAAMHPQALARIEGTLGVNALGLVFGPKSARPRAAVLSVAPYRTGRDAALVLAHHALLAHIRTDAEGLVSDFDVRDLVAAPRGCGDIGAAASWLVDLAASLSSGDGP